MKKSEIISICTESFLQHNNSQHEHRYTRGWDSCPADCNTCLPADQHICTMRKNQAGSGSSQTLGSVSQVGGYSLIVMLVNPLQIFNNLPSYLLIQFILPFIQNIPQQRTVQQIILKQFFWGGGMLYNRFSEYLSFSVCKEIIHDHFSMQLLYGTVDLMFLCSISTVSLREALFYQVSQKGSNILLQSFFQLNDPKVRANLLCFIFL